MKSFPILFILLLTPPVQADARPTIEVFTDAHFPMTGIDEIRQSTGATVTVYDLGAPGKWEEALSLGLPNTEAEALQRASQRLATTSDLQQQLLTAYQGHTQAMTRQISKFPAVVFDDEAVVYGVTDLLDALNRYRRWKEVHTP